MRKIHVKRLCGDEVIFLALNRYRKCLQSLIRLQKAFFHKAASVGGDLVILIEECGEPKLVEKINISCFKYMSASSENH